MDTLPSYADVSAVDYFVKRVSQLFPTLTKDGFRTVWSSVYSIWKAQRAFRNDNDQQYNAKFLDPYLYRAAFTAIQYSLNGMPSSMIVKNVSNYIFYLGWAYNSIWTPAPPKNATPQQIEDVEGEEELFKALHQCIM